MRTLLLLLRRHSKWPPVRLSATAFQSTAAASASGKAQHKRTDAKPQKPPVAQQKERPIAAARRPISQQGEHKALRGADIPRQQRRPAPKNVPTDGPHSQSDHNDASNVVHLLQFQACGGQYLNRLRLLWVRAQGNNLAVLVSGEHQQAKGRPDAFQVLDTEKQQQKHVAPPQRELCIQIKQWRAHSGQQEGASARILLPLQQADHLRRCLQEFRPSDNRKGGQQKIICRLDGQLYGILRNAYYLSVWQPNPSGTGAPLGDLEPLLLLSKHSLHISNYHAWLPEVESIGFPLHALPALRQALQAMLDHKVVLQWRREQNVGPNSASAAARSAAAEQFLSVAQSAQTTDPNKPYVFRKHAMWTFNEA